jgi:hypothetical protein
MSEEEKSRIIEAIANSILNQLSLNGVIEASKVYSLNLATNKYEEMSEEERKSLLKQLESASQPQVEAS